MNIKIDLTSKEQSKTAELFYVKELKDCHENEKAYALNVEHNEDGSSFNLNIDEDFYVEVYDTALKYRPQLMAFFYVVKSFTELLGGIKKDFQKLVEKWK